MFWAYHENMTCHFLSFATHRRIIEYIIYTVIQVLFTFPWGHEPVLHMPVHAVIKRNICSLKLSFAFISEFDQFLADRAAAGGQRTGSVKSGASRPRQRQMQMENQADDEMFGL